MRARLTEFYEDINRRRTVREFSNRPVPRDLIEQALRAAGTAPSGANFQPWHCGGKVKHYYPVESTGIATGLLITARHRAGLVCLTHTPSPMKFLNRILGRPRSERPFLLLVTGYPADGAKVPDIQRKTLEDFVSFIEQ